MRRLIILLSLLAGAGIAAWLYAGSLLLAGRPDAVGAPPPDLQAESVALRLGSPNRLQGWFLAGRPGGGAVLLLHPSRADRRSMTGRARFLHRAGFSVLLIDFQAHGESPGAHNTFGRLESRDAAAAARYLRLRLPGERLAVIGVSLGAAASVLGADALPVDALVLESLYTTFESAVANRLAMRLGGPGRLLTPLFLWQTRLWLGFDPATLSPIERVGSLSSPVLFIAGGKDRRTTEAESRALFARARPPKAFWLLDGARHEDFHGFGPGEYERRVLAFLNRHLR